MNLPQPLLTYGSRLAVHTQPFGKLVLKVFLKLVNMPLTARLFDYVIDFERALKSDDWSKVEGYFSTDAIYEVRNTDFACRLEGSRKIIAGFKHSLDGFDRNLKRSVDVSEGPHERENQVTFVWIGRYEVSNKPPLVISARQTAHYRDGLISLLTDDYLPGHGEKISAWVAKHGQGLSAAYE